MGEEDFDEEPYCETCFSSLEPACLKCSQGWQSIETAPKDCEVLTTDGNRQRVAEWSMDRWEYSDHYHEPWRPTHWMPLPDLPQ